MPRPQTKNSQIAQLRAQLEEEQRSSAALLNTVNVQKVVIDNTLGRLKVAEENLIRAKSTSSFQKKLPAEIRIKIYKLLLVNPKLSEVESIGRAVNYGKDSKFELTPALLQTCKAIQIEAEPILYGSNTFIIECIGGYGPMGCLHVPQSPLTRYPEPDFDTLDDSDTEDEMGVNMRVFSGTEVQFDFSTFKAMKKVKHWRMITSAYKPTPSNPIPAKSFVHFCQALCQLAPTQPQRSIEMVLVLARFPAPAASFMSEEAQYNFSQKQLNLILRPLGLLRDIKLVLNVAQFKTELPTSEQLCGSISDYYFPYSEAQTAEVNLERFMNLAPPIVQKYHALVEDLSPIEKVFKMHKRLEEYADLFERSGQFTKDMFTLQRGCEPNSPVREIRHFGWQLPRSSLGNPFKGPTELYHPVELAFSRAIIAKDKEDVDEFKAARASVLKELEPHYKRMMEASKKLRAFVEKERISGVFKGCDGCGVFHQYEEDPFESTLGGDLDRYIYELEKISKLFQRPMPDHIRIRVKKGATMYDSAYLNMDRERLFRKLRWMQTQDHLKDPSRTASQIAKWVKQLVEEMWVLCGLVSWQREELFKDDITDIGCRINKKLGAGLLDEELEWYPEGFESDDEYYYMHGHMMGD
ncbi:hypothetical protein DSL72_005413 [Monilinia vaccinii-corymbosi]|uniref:F-box domain-containing protein n=1 Tax=Monilinia vaccinii-corymbosi TaxID=61207 RepID=A0A8A3PFH8_9HELO|nr:hypothetical protein DSL72_005413 [Monilinia vaccinii-corymbosi]